MSGPWTITQATAYVSTGNATEQLSVTNFISGEVVFAQNGEASEQSNGPEPWIDAEWAPYETLPLLPPGIEFVGVDPDAVTPNLVKKQTTNEIALYVVPGAPTADLLLFCPSLTTTRYDSWGGPSHAPRSRLRMDPASPARRLRPRKGRESPR